jgi:hypothetical protein
MILALGALLLLVGGIALLIRNGESQPPITSHRGIAGSWKELSEKGIREASILRDQPWPFASIVAVPGGLPSQLRKQAEEVLMEPKPLRLRFGDARRVTALHSAGFWVVPGAGVICMFRAVKMAAACSGKRDVYRHGLLLELYKLDRPGGKPTAFTAFGLVPDGVASVVARIGRRRDTIPVVGNAYEIEASKPINIIPPGG